jgi:sortase A
MLALGLSTPAASMPALARTTALPPDAAPAAGAAPNQGRAPLIPGLERIHRPGRPERLVIQSVGIDTPVVPVEPVLSRGRLVWQTADSAAGHHAGSALPGENGTVVLSGHLNTPLSGGGAVFRTLPNIRVGDVIQVYAGGLVYRYEVREMKLVRPEQVDAIPSGAEPLITLITCFPDWTFGQRLLVIGTLVSGEGS